MLNLINLALSFFSKSGGVLSIICGCVVVFWYVYTSSQIENLKEKLAFKDLNITTSSLIIKEKERSIDELNSLIAKQNEAIESIAIDKVKVDKELRRTKEKLRKELEKIKIPEDNNETQRLLYYEELFRRL